MIDANSDDAFVEVPVHAGVLRATAELLDLLSGFFAGTDPPTRTRLGFFLVDRYGEEAANDPVIEASVMLRELTEAAELLHALAGDDGTDAGAPPF